MREKLYHIGKREKVIRSTLADANEARNWWIYNVFAKILIHEARRLNKIDHLPFLNHFAPASSTIAELYRYRWSVEIFLNGSNSFVLE